MSEMRPPKEVKKATTKKTCKTTKPPKEVKKTTTKVMQLNNEGVWLRRPKERVILTNLSISETPDGDSSMLS